jgi:MscS family membrane protein
MGEDLISHLEDAITHPWTVAFAVLVGGLITGRLLVAILRPLLVSATSRTPSTWDDQLVARMANPVSLILAVQAFRVAVPWLGLDDRAVKVAEITATIATTAAVVWIAFRGIDLARAILENRAWAVNRPASRSMLAISSRFGKVSVLVIGVIVLLAQLGVSVGSLIAGLGIGGLAIALGAQKSLENLFGTLSIGVDQPMREGDFVKIQEFVGTVEKIGLRSTRFRTLDRTLITIPNGQLANERIESYAARDRFHLYQVISLVHETTPAQLRTVLADLEAILRAHPKIWSESIVVRLVKISESSLDIDVRAWFLAVDWNEFQGIRQEILLAFLEALEKCGTRLARPARNVHVVQPG